MRFSKYIVPLLLLLLAGCKKESDLFEDEVTFVLTVYDDQGIALNGAQISFYSSHPDYLSGLAGNISGAVVTGVSEASGTTFKLQPQQDHWLLVTYDDPVRAIRLSNRNTSSKMDKLVKSSEIYASVTLMPSSANVAFWIKENTDLPVTVKFNGQTYTLTANSASAPTGPNDPNALTVGSEPGRYAWYATSARGCLWTGEVNLSNGAFVPVGFETCVRGSAFFYTPQNNNPGIFPVSLRLDNLDNAGSITATEASYTCGTVPGPGVLRVSRPPGMYTYVATSADGTCSWTGTFTLAADDCLPVVLGNCQ